MRGATSTSAGLCLADQVLQRNSEDAALGTNRVRVLDGI